MSWFYPVMWLVLAIVFVVVEAVSVQLVSVWLALGALAAIIPAAFDMSIAVQLIVFILIAGICLIFTRPFVKKVLAVKKVSTNADKVVGEYGLVTETIDNTLGTGRIMVDGLSWKAKTEDEAQIEAGCQVKILRIEGVTLTVEKAVVS